MELDSGVDSVSSTPRSVYQHNHNYNPNKLSADRDVVRLMCSFGGKILPRPHDNQLRYVGGDTRIVAIPRSASFSLLISKLSKLVNNVPYFTVKYQLPNEDLDALITVSSDEDVENMIEEFDRLSMAQQSNKVPRLRLFLFPSSNNDDVNDHEGNSRSNTSSIASLLDGSRKRENWFLDALNGGVSSEVAGAPAGSGDGGGGGLERGRSEASSIVSEVPDYLFGLDNVDEPGLRFKNRAGLGGEMVAGSDPGSPAFGSTSSATPMPNLPPVKTKPEHRVEEISEPVAQQAAVGYAGGPVWAQSPTPNPGSPYRVHHHPMQQIPVYYVPVGPGQNPGQPMQPSHMQPVPVSVPSHHYVQHYPSPVQQPVMGPSPGQVPLQVPYHGSGPLYGGGAPVQQVYYGAKNPAMGGHYPGPVGPVGGEESVGPGYDPSKGRNLQG